MKFFNINKSIDLKKTKYCIERKKELECLASSLQIKNRILLLIGKNGVGKTTIVKELKFQIKKNNIPDISKKQEIIYLDLNKLCTETSYLYDESVRAELCKLDYALKNNSILFIDNMENIQNNDYNILDKIKDYVTKNNLKVIGAINTKHDSNFFKSDIFERIIIEEQKDKILREIANKKFIEYCDKYKIKKPTKDSMYSIESFLLTLSKRQIIINEDIMKYEFNKDELKDYRVVNDLHNPGLIIDIIENIFIDAMKNENNLLTKQNFINGVYNCKNCWNEQFVSDYVNGDIYNNDCKGIYIYETENKIIHKERVKQILKSRM